MPKGDFKAALGLRTTAAIRHYFTTHPCCTSKDCARALGIRPSTVATHAARIRAEWRNQPEPSQ